VKKRVEKVYGVYNEYKYEIWQGQSLVYEAGNCKHDSSASYQLPIDDPHRVPLETMKQYCEQTGKEIATERKAKFFGVQYEAKEF
jgi:hypothetical protein